VDRLFLQGRTIAATYEEAVRLTEEKIRARGFEPVNVRPYPCPIQPYPEMVWWEWQAEIREPLNLKDSPETRGPNSGVD